MLLLQANMHDARQHQAEKVRERVPGVVEPQEPWGLGSRPHSIASHRICGLGSRRSLEDSSKVNCAGGWEAGWWRGQPS